MTLRLATPADLPTIAALREGVGWQTHPWAVLEAMRGPHARFFLALDGSRVVAMGSGIGYGRLGVVGNMVVAVDRRREGLGSRVLEHVIAFLDERGVERMELFATAEGRPLYARYGFEPMAAGSMVEIPAAARARLEPLHPGRVRGATPSDLPALAAYDLPRFGGHRAPILAAAVEDADREVLLAEVGGRLAGYAVIREPAVRLGPWLADDPDVAARLLAAALDARPAADRVFANVPGENRAGRAWLEGIGATLTASDGRMARGPMIPRRLETVYGNAVGALG